MRLVCVLNLLIVISGSLPAHADHIYKPQTANKAPRLSPRICVRNKGGACSSDTVALNELNGQWHGNLTVTDPAEFRRFAKISGLCKAAGCAKLSPYLSFGLGLQKGQAHFTLKAFSDGSAATALTGQNSVRLTPSKDGFMIRRRLDLTAENDSTLQIRMQLEDDASLAVKVTMHGNVIAHGTLTGSGDSKVSKVAGTCYRRLPRSRGFSHT